MNQFQSRVMIADHHPLRRTGLSTLLTRSLGVAEIILATDFVGARAEIARAPNLSLTMVGLDLPKLHGVVGLRRLRLENPSLRIVVLADSRERDVVLTVLSAGVHGYMLTDTPIDDMIEAFEKIFAGEIYVPPFVSDLRWRTVVVGLVASNKIRSLTERQGEVLRLLAAGRSNKEIARTLRIAESTVKTHVLAAYRELGVHNRASAVAALKAESRRTAQTATPPNCRHVDSSHL